ncbi:MAG: hypothetical protein L0Z55_05800 [Planctomycetes bacterium]|nr:hypothetical protein [Planctomycetota bacterium]
MRSTVFAGSFIIGAVPAAAAAGKAPHEMGRYFEVRQHRAGAGKRFRSAGGNRLETSGKTFTEAGGGGPMAPE